MTAELEALRDSLRRFLTAVSPESAVRSLMATPAGYDPRVWQRMADELGLIGLAIPEAYGGTGFGFAELAVVFEEQGRALLAAPYLSTVVLGAQTLLATGDGPVRERLLPAIAAGRSRVTLAFTDEHGRIDEAAAPAAAERGSEGWTVSGRACFVLDGYTADVVLVVASTDAGVSLFEVAAGAPGLTRSPMSTMDETRKLARLDLERCPANPVGAAGDGWRVVRSVLDLALVAVAAEQVGGAQRCLELTVEYAKLRTQFGQPIGAFQAVKHQCAELLMDVESARTAASLAATSAATGHPDLPAAARIAATVCGEAFQRVAEATIHLHGGIGFTWEHPAHLYLRRAISSRLLFGEADRHLAELATMLAV